MPITPSQSSQRIQSSPRLDARSRSAAGHRRARDPRHADHAPSPERLHLLSKHHRNRECAFVRGDVGAVVKIDGAARRLRHGGRAYEVQWAGSGSGPCGGVAPRTFNVCSVAERISGPVRLEDRQSPGTYHELSNPAKSSGVVSNGSEYVFSDGHVVAVARRSGCRQLRQGCCRDSFFSIKVKGLAPQAPQGMVALGPAVGITPLDDDGSEVPPPGHKLVEPVVLELSFVIPCGACHAPPRSTVDLSHSGGGGGGGLCTVDMRALQVVWRHRDSAEWHRQADVQFDTAGGDAPGCGTACVTLDHHLSPCVWSCVYNSAFGPVYESLHADVAVRHGGPPEDTRLEVVLREADPSSSPEVVECDSADDEEESEADEDGAAFTPSVFIANKEMFHSFCTTWTGGSGAEAAVGGADAERCSWSQLFHRCLKDAAVTFSLSSVGLSRLTSDQVAVAMSVKYRIEITGSDVWELAHTCCIEDWASAKADGGVVTVDGDSQTPFDSIASAIDELQEFLNSAALSMQGLRQLVSNTFSASKSGSIRLGLWTRICDWAAFEGQKSSRGPLNISPLQTFHDLRARLNDLRLVIVFIKELFWQASMLDHHSRPMLDLLSEAKRHVTGCKTSLCALIAHGTSTSTPAGYHVGSLSQLQSISDELEKTQRHLTTIRGKLQHMLASLTCDLQLRIRGFLSQTQSQPWSCLLLRGWAGSFLAEEWCGGRTDNLHVLVRFSPPLESKRPLSIRGEATVRQLKARIVQMYPNAAAAFTSLDAINLSSIGQQLMPEDRLLKSFGVSNGDIVSITIDKDIIESDLATSLLADATNEALAAALDSDLEESVVGQAKWPDALMQATVDASAEAALSFLGQATGEAFAVIEDVEEEKKNANMFEEDRKVFALVFHVVNLSDAARFIWFLCKKQILQLATQCFNHWRRKAISGTVGLIPTVRKRREAAELKAVQYSVSFAELTEQVCPQKSEITGIAIRQTQQANFMAVPPSTAQAKTKSKGSHHILHCARYQSLDFVSVVGSKVHAHNQVYSVRWIGDASPEEDNLTVESIKESPLAGFECTLSNGFKFKNIRKKQKLASRQAVDLLSQPRHYNAGAGHWCTSTTSNDDPPYQNEQLQLARPVPKKRFATSASIDRFQSPLTRQSNHDLVPDAFNEVKEHLKEAAATDEKAAEEAHVDELHKLNIAEQTMTITRNSSSQFEGNNLSKRVANEGAAIDSFAVLRVSVEGESSSQQRVCDGIYSRSDIVQDGYQLWFHKSNDRVLFFERSATDIMHWRIGCRASVAVLGPSRAALGLKPSPSIVEVQVTGASLEALLTKNGSWKLCSKKSMGKSADVHIRSIGFR